MFTSDKNFSMELTPGTALKPVTLEFENKEYKICDQKDIALLESQVRLCVDKVEQTLALNDEKLIGTGKNVLIKYVGKKDGKKTITFQHVFGLPINNMPWTATLETFATKNYPLVKLGNTNYELVGGSTLDSFTLGGSGIAMNSTKEAFEAGVIVVGENQVVFQKALDGNSIKFDVTLLKEKILSSTAFNFTANLNLPIVTEVGGEVYTLSPTKLGGDTIDFKVLKGTDVLYQGKLAKNVPKKILLTNGKIITVTYLETVKGVAKLAVSQ